MAFSMINEGQSLKTTFLTVGKAHSKFSPTVGHFDSLLKLEKQSFGYNTYSIKENNVNLLVQRTGYSETVVRKAYTEAKGNLDAAITSLEKLKLDQNLARNKAADETPSSPTTDWSFLDEKEK